MSDADLPAAAPAVTMPYRVAYGDTDAMGVVYYANYLVIFERARTELLRARGFAYREMEARGWALPVLEAHVEYKAPARYDDLLEVRAALTWCKGVRLRIDCEVRRDGTLLATGHTVHACLDLKTRRPTRVPAEIERLAVSP